ncbi:MAG: hypothetical protein IJZ44_07050 [Lachnospiraceae bacterium]|nr:hypothetical protein [Lachnospiraceae bacterium]
MKEINVEQIMQEIRADAKNRKADSVPLRFADVSLADSKLEMPTRLETEILKKEIVNLNALWDTSLAIDINSNSKIKVFVKKILYKMVMTIMRSNILSQTIFNLSVVNIMNQMNCLVEENEAMKKELQQIKQEVEQLRAAQ